MRRHLTHEPPSDKGEPFDRSGTASFAPAEIRSLVTAGEQPVGRERGPQLRQRQFPRFVASAITARQQAREVREPCTRIGGKNDGARRTGLRMRAGIEMPIRIRPACRAPGAPSCSCWRLWSAPHARAWTTPDRKTPVAEVAADRRPQVGEPAQVAQAGPAAPVQWAAPEERTAAVWVALPVLRALPMVVDVLVPARAVVVPESVVELARVVVPGADRAEPREPPAAPPDQRAPVEQESRGRAALRARRARRATHRRDPMRAKEETPTCAPTPAQPWSSERTSA